VVQYPPASRARDHRLIGHSPLSIAQVGARLLAGSVRLGQLFAGKSVTVPIEPMRILTRAAVLLVEALRRAPGEFPQLVRPELWQAAQEQLSSRNPRRRARV